MTNQPVPCEVVASKPSWRNRVHLSFDDLVQMAMQTETIFPEVLTDTERSYAYGQSPESAIRLHVAVAEHNRTCKPKVKVSLAVEGTRDWDDMLSAYGFNQRQVDNVQSTADDIGSSTEPRVFLYIRSNDNSTMTPSEIKSAMDLLDDLVYNGDKSDWIREMKAEYGRPR